MSVIEVHDLRKSFGRTAALTGLDLEVRPGEVHGFLGPNGAGKSTTIRILLGLLRADGGTVTVLGRDPWRDAVHVHRGLAYVPGDVSLWPNLSGGEVIDLLTRLRGGADEALLRRLVEDFEFDPRKRSRSYSRGNRQKVALIAAFARPAELYVLDEPTSGLDPLMDEVFRRHIERVRDEGAAVLLSSHMLAEVERLCDRVTIIRSGVDVETGTLQELRHLTRTTFRLTGADEAAARALPGAHEPRSGGDWVEFDVDAADVPAVLAGVAALRPAGLTVAPPSLEELFLHHYGDRP
ncbi:ABC transporter ATP-binding protein [Naasia sp. SYSU D00948]|uniref:ABC transporter ATP-binding protein n=1 Tax=Naasia sp. SYSU D00948 TaxID=2817379 RepID=UPI001B30041A|nr:ABC transporter ATP-binding protein [Naasia sp. SYSU D00948]